MVVCRTDLLDLLLDGLLRRDYELDLCLGGGAGHALLLRAFDWWRQLIL
jgi:hypothetical protein